MFEKKVALVTGGSRGIGRAVALRLAELGADVAIFYAGNEAAAAETVELAREKGARALAYCVDVASSEAVGQAAQQVRAELGPVDLLVNNAGIARDKLAMRMSDEDFDRVLEVNLSGAFHMIRALCPDFIKRRSGRIVNITSVSGLMGNAGQANYSASKAGLVGLTKSIARELAGRGVTCNAVAPGFIATDMTDAMNEKVLETALSAVPLKRIGRPEDVAEAVVFLLSDRAAYITGEVIKVDGGMYM